MTLSHPLTCACCRRSFLYERREGQAGRRPKYCPECRSLVRYPKVQRTPEQRSRKNALARDRYHADIESRHPDRPRKTKEGLCESCYRLELWRGKRKAAAVD
jgi:hypothetical protein